MEGHRHSGVRGSTLLSTSVCICAETGDCAGELLQNTHPGRNFYLWQLAQFSHPVCQREGK